MNTATKRQSTFGHYSAQEDTQDQLTKKKQRISTCNHDSFPLKIVKPSPLSTHLHIDMWSYLLDMLGAQEHGCLRTTSREVRTIVIHARQSHLTLVVCEPRIQTGFRKCNTPALLPSVTSIKGVCRCDGQADGGGYIDKCSLQLNRDDTK